jgi:fatty acid/phospholipid biosynthesis enzyme
MRVTISVDAMGGDHGPPVTVAASLRFLEETPDASIVLVGREEAIRKLLDGARSTAADRVSIQAAGRSRWTKVRRRPAREEDSSRGHQPRREGRRRHACRGPPAP